MVTRGPESAHAAAADLIRGRGPGYRKLVKIPISEAARGRTSRYANQLSEGRLSQKSTGSNSEIPCIKDSRCRCMDYVGPRH